MTTKFWDKRAQKYDENARNHSEGFNRMIAGMKTLTSASDTVLDLGCASGEFTFALANHVQSIYGIDTSENMIALAREKLKNIDTNNIEFHALSVFDKMLDGQSYSAILALNILHLVEDIPKTLERLHALLPEEGLLISQTPCLGEGQWFVKNLMGFAQATGVVPKIHSLKYRDLETMMANAGFRLSESKVWNVKSATKWIVARKIA